MTHNIVEQKYFKSMFELLKAELFETWKNLPV